MKQFKMPLDDDPRNYPEDFHHENGKYLRECIICQNMFIGYKRRYVCKICVTDIERPDPE